MFRPNRNQILLTAIGLLLIAVGLHILSGCKASNVGVEYVQGKHIYVPVGEVVTVHTTIHASGGDVKGWLKVEVRKDMVLVPDQVLTTLQKYVSLNSGETKTFTMGTFVAQDKTCDLPGCVREYFVKVYFNDKCIYDPTDPNNREWVKTY